MRVTKHQLSREGSPTVTVYRTDGILICPMCQETNDILVFASVAMCPSGHVMVQTVQEDIAALLEKLDNIVG